MCVRIHMYLYRKKNIYICMYILLISYKKDEKSEKKAYRGLAASGPKRF